MEVYLINHTHVENPQLCYGQSDIPVAITFESEVAMLQRILPDGVHAIYTSPLTRCTLLAKNLFPGQDMIVSDKIKELNFGDWELQDWDEINHNVLDEWLIDFVNIAPPNGETYNQLNTRVKSFIQNLLQQPHERVAIVTHPGVIRCFMAHLLHFSLKQALKIPTDHASITGMKLYTESAYDTLLFLNKR